MTVPASERAFRLLLRVLPASLRRRAGDEMLDVLRARLARASGPLARGRVWLREAAGVLAAAARARWPDAWTRRTDPAALDFDHATDAVRPRPRSRRPSVHQLRTDVRFALRTFARRPVTLGAAALSLALGIGASSAMFSVVDTVLLRPLPFDEPERLVAVYPTLPELAGHPTLAELRERATFSWPEYWDLHRQQRSFERVAAYGWTTATVAGDAGGPPTQVRIARVVPSLFPDSAFGGQPARTVLLGHAFWQTRLGGSRDVVGRTLALNEQPYTILGVLPPHAAIGTMEADLWTARVHLPADATTPYTHHDVSGVVARLRDGVSMEQAREDVARILRTAPPPDHLIHGATVFPLQADRTRAARPALLVLLAASGLLLVVGCANVAAILLGVGLERRLEIAIRGALGASRWRVARQLLTESVTLALVGGAGGVLLAAAATRLLLLLAPAGVPRLAEASLDLRVLAFALVVSVASGLLFGLLPALSLARERPGQALAASRGSTGMRGWAQSAVVVGELALATVLLVSGALLVRTLSALNHVDPGFRADELLAVRLAPPVQRFRGLEGDSAAQASSAFMQEIVDGVAAIPGVRGVAVTSILPLTSDRGNNDVLPEHHDATMERPVIAERRFVSAGYFETMGMRIVEGRPITGEDDRAGARPTTVISEGLARRFWPNESAVGKRLAFWDSSRATIVGVAADVHDESLDAPTTIAYYLPLRQYGMRFGSLVVRTAGDPAAVASAVRERIWQVDPGTAVPTIDPYASIVATQVSEERYRMRLMLVFAGVAAFFAAMGVYGVTARSVARRTREIGIRVALGAQPREVLAGVLLQGARLAAVGTAVGLLLFLLAAPLLDGMLYGVRATDPASLLAIVLLVALLALLSALPPGRRATTVTPMEALRSD